jgi:integrase
LKDSGARVGEACRLKWTDVNSENCTLSINNPEKGSRSRTIKVSEKTLAMLKAMPKKYGDYIFNPNAASVKNVFQMVRNRLAIVHQNARFKQIHMHSFRHWRATKEYQRTKSIVHVKYLLGHKCIQNTDRYTHIVEFADDHYYSAVAKSVEESRKLIEDGWEYVTDMEEYKIFRKPK